eukprot:5130638-Pyramimonas_sp.AAC.1
MTRRLMRALSGMAKGPVSPRKGMRVSMSSLSRGSKVTEMVQVMPADIAPGKVYSMMKKSLYSSSRSRILNVLNEYDTFVRTSFFVYTFPTTKSLKSTSFGLGRNAAPLNSLPHTTCQQYASIPSWGQYASIPSWYTQVYQVQSYGILSLTWSAGRKRCALSN